MLNPYLTFAGNCREAFEFYRSVFGGEFEVIQTFADGPPDMGVPDEAKDLVMHVSLPVGPSMLMGSDAGPGNPPVNAGSNFQISINPESREAADALFAKLSDGGNVGMPMAEMFWGSYFGTCEDRFGIGWMINFNATG